MKLYLNISIFALLAGLSFSPVQPTRSTGYDFFVDKNSSASAEDGSEQYPWKTIGAALAHIANEKLQNKIVFVKKGTYPESTNISNGTKLVGESESETVIDADGFHNAVNFVSTKTELKNLTIKNAEATNIIVDKRSKAMITDCSIEKAGKFGIEVKDSSAVEKYKFTLENSKISESGSQGLYVGKRKISISNNEIFDNGEEGIDLHQGGKGTVSGNNIHGNSESGIESILSGASLTFKSNRIENNHTQGISVQAYSTKRKGKVKISRNTIKNNNDYGIRYANYTHSIGPNKFKIFVAKYVKLSKNTISGNDKGKYAYE